jgi:hypothetical protein
MNVHPQQVKEAYPLWIDVFKIGIVVARGNYSLRDVHFAAEVWLCLLFVATKL